MPTAPESSALTLKQMSAIGIRALTETPLGRTALRYDTDISGTKSLVTTDLIAIMTPHLGMPATKRAAAKKASGPTKRAAPKPASKSLPPLKAKAAISEFIGRFLNEIRKIICKKKSCGAMTRTALAALASWIFTFFHVASSVATGVAATILISVTTAAKGAFCQMTAAQAAAIFPTPGRKATKQNE